MTTTATPKVKTGHCAGCRFWICNLGQSVARCTNTRSPHYRQRIGGGATCSQRRQWRPRTVRKSGNEDERDE